MGNHLQMRSQTVMFADWCWLSKCLNVEHYTLSIYSIGFCLGELGFKSPSSHGNTGGVFIARKLRLKLPLFLHSPSGRRTIEHWGSTPPLHQRSTAGLVYLLVKTPGQCRGHQWCAESSISHKCLMFNALCYRILIFLADLSEFHSSRHTEIGRSGNPLIRD